MALSEAARTHHDELFGEHRSTLTQTDPEFVELFDNFAFDEIIAHDELPVTLRLQAILAALIAMQALGELRVMLGAALRVGVTPVEIKEIVYQAVPYVGIGRAYEALHLVNEVLTGAGVALPLAGQSTTTPATREAAGRSVQEEIFGDAIAAMYEASPRDQVHIQHHLSAHCFGDHYTRTGLDLATRELLTFAMLTALGGCEPQLTGHVAGNAAVGNGRARLLEVLTQLLPYVGYPRTLNAIGCINKVLPEDTGSADEPDPH
ncbi:4-carboxymuconolactone decarboxylase [Raineyella antarctica]|uniref:4-carboxymuconolactone decarboxylase n=1 Tax=Raineyella antarctica TaxID=1577474 RepID=A0A1G6GEN3_9ACTN|nr:carboxymuconolactone decarboxylase family protein [Raineyella antarctica]SDB80430.1 4-carboxymuconolactone decarboxylase [Raineyella antarctica]